MIAFDTDHLSDCSAMLAHATRSGADTPISLDADAGLTLHDVLEANPTAGDFHFA